MGNRQDGEKGRGFSPSQRSANGTRFLRYFSLGSVVSAVTLIGVYLLSRQTENSSPDNSLALHIVFLVMVVLIAIGAWAFILVSEKNREADETLGTQTRQLLQEIAARERSEHELKRAREAADSKNVAKSKYVRGLSHELRTPLNAILGYAQLLEQDASLPDRLKHNARVIRRSGAHLSSLVDGLLDLSMIEAGRLQVRKEEFRFAEFLHQLTDMMSLQARNAGLAFIFEPAANLPEIISTDEKKLRQILINLLSNAIRYTDEGSVTLRVLYSGQVARFEIEDTGIGVSPDNIERIFSPFERVDNPQRSAISGTGLGLTITQHLTLALGGELAVKSELGKGSTFSVRLFLPQALASAKPAAATNHAISGYAGERQTVLTIDDDINQLNFLREALEKLGFRVLAETNGRDGLDRAISDTPDLVILDMSMPDMNGWQVARNLREVSAKRIPVIILSAFVPENSEIRAAQDIHDAYLMKPVRPDRLLETIQKVTGVTWTYTAPETTQISTAEGGIPDAGALVALRNLAQIGHLQGIKSKLDELSGAQAKPSATLIHLRELAENSDIAGFRKTIEKLLSDASR